VRAYTVLRLQIAMRAQIALHAQIALYACTASGAGATKLCMHVRMHGPELSL
jgi:hypothetical protein